MEGAARLRRSHVSSMVWCLHKPQEVKQMGLLGRHRSRVTNVKGAARSSTTPAMRPNNNAAGHGFVIRSMLLPGYGPDPAAGCPCITLQVVFMWTC